ncbi:transcriptional regulator Spx [Salicibibacter cibarius]|uniref:Transcriptional regulator Spx n=1 Tax=Salicibibacter cibarius TaxID=2743000 RepID=A0A7T7CA45_9BACI|nr:transcriptional regulator Spx [Salicibibacter cibarius]QQK74465.1 transcriptional regulator Spx [Salicibibacter cibarius]
MVHLLTASGCSSCRQAKEWLTAQHIPFKERNIFTEPLSVEEVKTVMFMTEDGVNDVISRRSKTFRRLNVDLDALSLQHLFQLISQYPGLLRKPIIFDDKRLQVGYQEEEMRQFLPRQVRSYLLHEARKIEKLAE